MESTFNLSVLDVSVSKADCEARHIAGGILQREQRLILRSKLKHNAAEAGGIAESFWPRSTPFNLDLWQKRDWSNAATS